MDNDQELLIRFAEEGDQPALAEVVHRYMDLVYFAALRRTHGDSEIAADVAQQVFISLARHARKLAHHPALGAWLHTATRNTAFTQMKAETRRRIRETEAAPELSPSTTEAATDWAALRPFIDQALDSLSKPDRTSILLRFFQQASLRDVAESLHVSEDAARMRVDRAVEKLRQHLSKRGVKSTAAALSLALSQSSVLATPGAVAASIAAQACATPPLSLGLLGFLSMSKITGPVLSGFIAASATAGTWVVSSPGVTSQSLSELRQEHARIAAATGPQATPASLDAIVNEYEAGTESLVQRVKNRSQAGSSSAQAATPSDSGKSSKTAAEVENPKVHRYHGLATPRDAYLTFAWATNSAQVETLSAMMWIDADVRQHALTTMAKQPPGLVSRYPAPEQFYAFITAAVCLQAPPPAADIVSKGFDGMQPTEVAPGRLKYPNNYEFQKTDQGWKWVLPDSAVERWLHVLQDSVLTAPPAE